MASARCSRYAPRLEAERDVPLSLDLPSNHQRTCPCECTALAQTAGPWQDCGRGTSSHNPRGIAKRRAHAPKSNTESGTQLLQFGHHTVCHAGYAWCHALTR